MDQQWVDVGSPWIKKKVQFHSAELKCLESEPEKKNTNTQIHKKNPLTLDFLRRLSDQTPTLAAA